MEPSVIERIKESISTRRQNIVEWLRGTPPRARGVRVGPVGEEGVVAELQALDTALKKADDNTLGLCDVCHDYVETSRLEMDYAACVCIEHLTGDERARLESELELSQKVQRALLPSSVPRIAGVEIAAFSQPAHFVGGDYFDFLRFKDGSHAIVIADVMGKGMPASMLMASLQASLRIIAPESLEPAEVIARLNHIFCHNIQLTKFVTVFLARYDERTRMLTYCNAGHNPPLILKHIGTMIGLPPTGAAIGLVEQTTFGQSTVSLERGDRLLLYTDGVVESRSVDGQLFGDERLERVVSGCRSLSANQMIDTLRTELQGFAGTKSPTDDTTMVAIRVAG